MTKNVTNKISKIFASKVLFIKLGSGGEFEKNCIEKDQTLKLGYEDIDHNLCVTKNWKSVSDFFLITGKTTPSTATSHSNQIKQFYEEDEKTLWITFYANKIWWCFSKNKITLLPDGTKTRPVIGKWSDKDLNGNVLLSSNISGKLLKTQGFRGTICSVREQKYALAKINCEQMQEVVDVEQALITLKQKLSFLIQHLLWKDFEILLDLIFRQSGWQRVEQIGKAKQTIDLELLSPVTGERAIVQIKAESTLKEFLSYRDKFVPMNNDYAKFFYIVHTPAKELKEYQNDTDINLYFVDKVAELTISAGLVDWIVKKTS